MFLFLRERTHRFPRKETHSSASFSAGSSAGDQLAEAFELVERKLGLRRVELDAKHSGLLSWLKLLPVRDAVRILTDLISRLDKERVSHVDWLETALLHRSTLYREWVGLLSSAAALAALSAIERAGLTRSLGPEEMLELTRRSSSEEESGEVAPRREWLRAPAVPHVSF